MCADSTARLKTALTQLTGMTHPIVLAPMAMVSGGELAGAVSRAGGLGLIGGGYGDSDFLEQQFALAAGESVGVGFITWRLMQKPALLDQALAHKPVAVMLSFGAIEPFAQKIKASGATLIAQVQTVQQAQAAVASGADVVVAQGTEAGGHGAARATLPLVPAVVDALPNTPVIAAGGIADGRGLAASLMLGASGALMGSRFYACEQSLAPAEAQHTAVASSGDHTIRSSVFDTLRGLDWPQPYNLRSLANQATQQWHGDLHTLKSTIEPEQKHFQQAVSDRNYNIAPVIVGECVDLINQIKPAGELLQQCVDEAVACLTRPVHFGVLS